MANEWDNLLQTIKELFPQFHITKNDLLHPTSTVAVKFYTNFITEFQDKVQFVSGPYYNPENFRGHLETEDWIFQTMYHIFKTIDSLKFMVSDIYEPTPVRNKSFFKICCHLLSFTETILEDTEAEVDNILKIKENTIKLKNDHEQILSEIHLKATKISELSESIEKKLQELSERKVAHEQNKDTMEQHEKMYAKEEKSIEMLKQQLQMEEQKLAILEKKDKELSEQSITEVEYKNLLTTVEDLKNQCNLLGAEQMNMDDFLIHENNELVHYQDCRKRVPDIEDFDLEIVQTVIKYEDELKDLEIENEKLINDKINPLKLLKTQNQNNLEEIKQQVEILKAKFEEILKKVTKNKRDVLHKINTIKEDMMQDINTNIKVREALNKEINTFTAKINNLKNIFCAEYNKIAQAEVAVKEYLKQMIFNISTIK